MSTLTGSARIRREDFVAPVSADTTQVLALAQGLSPAQHGLVKRLMIELLALDRAGQHDAACKLIEDIRIELARTES